MKGLIGKKIGMTQVFTPDGKRIPVTVVHVGANKVVQQKFEGGKDGYSAVKLGYGEVHKSEKEGSETRWRMTKPMVGVFQKAGVEPRKHLVEFRLEGDKDVETYGVGDDVKADVFTPGQFVDVTGTSKGRGFAGVMKRHNFSGAATQTHGTHEYFRHAGSIGASAWPARVIKGKRMAGHYGNARSTVMNLHVIDVLPEEGYILIKGAVPGPNGGIVQIRTATKRAKAFKPTGMEPEAAE